MPGYKTPLAIFYFAIFKLLYIIIITSYNSFRSSPSPPPSLTQFYLFIIMFFFSHRAISPYTTRHPPINYCENIRFCRRRCFRSRSDARREIRFTHSTRGVAPVITFHTSFRYNNVLPIVVPAMMIIINNNNNLYSGCG